MSSPSWRRAVHDPAAGGGAPGGAVGGGADGGEVQEEAEVAGDAEPSRVGVALAVDEEEVGGALQHLERLEEDGELAEGEEAGDVGEGYGGFDDVLLDGLQVRVGEEDDGGAGGVAPTAAAQEGEVAAGDGADIGLGRVAVEEGDGFGWGGGPGVQGADAHAGQV